MRSVYNHTQTASSIIFSFLDINKILDAEQEEDEFISSWVRLKAFDQSLIQIEVSLITPLRQKRSVLRINAHLILRRAAESGRLPF